jgi:hypothetical protein
MALIIRRDRESTDPETYTSDDLKGNLYGKIAEKQLD